ncbi:thiamine phosphate synthase [Campylobacter sp. VBCF_05 NA6]|uniref:thiamine phosphate synthase n=1 Tax=unclassified Campylobacter TaxID=2593542 RepID=UPI0022E99F1B|nr:MULTISPECIES: thiamine phosphate synthase [unclassified Campylobacter]MDA3058121.1 thiamine phosphate synthase [Campylobacter sp. VBCF_04 NA7]MDA3059692.1 thiamine phosphate synthase [Campylobacter sp. VBCF_05 NA6]
MSEIYALTDDVLTPNSSVFSQVREILDSGVKLVQYRSKLPRQDETLIASLISLCEDYGAKLIINDNVVLAKKLRAHGVHIGKDDGEIKNVREFLGAGSIIGVSCYSDLERARAAQEGGASYAAFGAMFASSTKKEAPLCPHEIVQMAKRELEIPVAIIGGISEQNLAEILPLNADYIALVSAIYRPKTISQNIKNLQGIINGYN